MSRYIDADEIVYFNDTGEDRPIEAALVAYKGQIDRIPSADVAPVVHGHWETYAYEDGFVCAVCSACKWSSGAMWWGYAIKHFDFCPHCGAKMDESEEPNENDAE